MSCRLPSRIIRILFLAATLPLCITTHGSGFKQHQSAQVARTLQNGRKLNRGGNLEITEQRSNTANSDTRRLWASQVFHETKNLKSYESSASFPQSNNNYMLTPRLGATEELFQSDSPGFDGQAVQGKVNLSTLHVTKDLLQMSPSVQCSPAAIILTAKGSNYVHLLVDRVGASPVSLLRLPSHCGYNVKVTWRDLLLIAPYDGCYVLQQNGSYVLPLLWWGMPISVSCPMTPALAPAMPSGFCSYLGMTLKIEGSLRDVGKYRIKVNGEWVPLVSNTCAYRIDSAPEDLIVFIPFTVQCAKDGRRTLDVLLDGKMYTVSCQHPYLFHYSGVIPLGPSFVKPDVPKPFLVPEITTMEQTQHQILLPYEQTNPVGAIGLYDSSLVPFVHPSPIPTTSRTKITPPQFLPPFKHLQQNTPMVYPPFTHPMYPNLHNVYQQTQKPPVSHLTEYKSEIKSSKSQTVTDQEPPIGLVPQAPQWPLPSQAPHVRDGFPVLANGSSQLSPVLTCKGDRLRAYVPSAKINSIKVKDVRRKVWVPVSSASAQCSYSLQRKGRGVVFISPLPACHSYTVSPALLSLSLKFWNPMIRKHHAVRLQCPYIPPSATAASYENLPSEPQKPLGKPKIKGSPIDSQNPIVLVSSPPPRSTASSFLSSQFTKPTSPSASQIHQPQVLCHSKAMNVTLPPGPITDLMVQSPTIGTEGSIKAVLLKEAPSHCRYLMKENPNGGIHILLPYESCHMAHKDGWYRIVLKYQTADDHRVEAILSCHVPMNHECSLPIEQRLTCGSSSISAVDCHELGCCYCIATQTCYYPMDECTADRHFVFSVPASLTEPPLSPALLVAAGNGSCTPQRVVADLALFKIPLDGCGAHKYEVGNTVIYMLEILNTLHSVTLNYGTITRDSPFRLLVECRYLYGTVASVGYLVKSPSLGPSIQAQGVFGVQLRIAKDQQYSSYYPQYHRPLRKLLGKPLYLEVRLLNPLDPSAVLLVHYCVAYPRSAHSAWVLIYDGCPNPLDVTPSHEPPPTPPGQLANHVRRFTVSTFQFLENIRKDTPTGDEEMEEGEEEEIYFMCATEVCLPSEGPCVEGCIDRAVESGSPTTKS